jgi:hypothetical protein
MAVQMAVRLEVFRFQVELRGLVSPPRKARLFCVSVYKEVGEVGQEALIQEVEMAGAQ